MGAHTAGINMQQIRRHKAQHAGKDRCSKAEPHACACNDCHALSSVLLTLPLASASPCLDLDLSRWIPHEADQLSCSKIDHGRSHPPRSQRPCAVLGWSRRRCTALICELQQFESCDLGSRHFRNAGARLQRVSRDQAEGLDGWMQPQTSMFSRRSERVESDIETSNTQLQLIYHDQS